MREVVHLLDVLLGRLLVAGEFELRMQLDAGDRQLALGIFLHVADGFVDVFVEHEFLLTGGGEESEHVATGERRDERFLRIDSLRVAEISGRGRGLHFVAAVEAPGVIAVVGFVFEVGRGALPGERHFVFGHAFR